jgi:hypothetical protein
MRCGRISFISFVPPLLVDLLINDYDQIMYNVNIISVLIEKQIPKEMYTYVYIMQIHK